MDLERVGRLHEFAAWVGAHLKGDEKGEGQLFLDRLFRAFGHQGPKEAGAVLEQRIKTPRGTLYADLVWKPHVIIEMKNGWWH